MTQRPTPQLDYARPLPMHRRMIVRRALLIAAVLAFAWWGHRFGAVMWRYAQIRYWQHRCLTYSPPGDRIVYEDGLPLSKAAWKNSPIASKPTVLTSNRPFLSGAADPYERFARLVPDPFYFTPFYHDDGIVFLHGRADPSGHERLVMVQFAMRSASELWFNYASWPDAVNHKGRATLSLLSVTKDPKLRLFAGQADAADHSHFTIRFEIGGKEGTIDGWLRQNDVRLSVRDGPGRIR